MRWNPILSTAQHDYERIRHRVRALICDPKIQRIQCVTVRRLDEESPSGWQRLVDEISETAGVRVSVLEDEAIRMAWNDYCEF